MTERIEKTDGKDPEIYGVFLKSPSVEPLAVEDLADGLGIATDPQPVHETLASE